jgi:hypothetical protein
MDASIDGDFSLGSSMEDFDASRHALSATPSQQGLFESSQKEAEKDRIATTETIVVRSTKILVIVILTATAVTLSVLISRDVTQYEADLFESSYSDGSHAILDKFQSNLEGVIETINVLGMQLTSWSQVSNSSWPAIALPDFEVHAGNARLMSGVLTLSVISIIENPQQQPVYEAFVQENLDWIGNEETRSTVYPNIFRIENDGQVPETFCNPCLPYWQSSPALTSAVNFNTGSSSLLIEEVQLALGSNQVLLGKDLNLTNTPLEELFPEQIEPMLPIYIPIFGSFEEDRTTQALISTMIGWSTLLQGLLSPDEEGYVVVIENVCSGALTFEINGGVSTFISRGDFHEDKYDKYQASFTFDQLFKDGGSVPWTRVYDDYCPYMLNVYPSQDLRDSYESNRALLYTLAVALLFAVTLIFFLVFNRVVEYRQRKVMQRALEARAVVASLFPAGVREKLLKDQRDNLKEQGKKEKEKKALVDKVPAPVPVPSPDPSSSVDSDDNDGDDKFDNEADEKKTPSWGRRPPRNLVRRSSMRKMVKGRSVRRFGTNDQSSAKIKSFLNENMEDTAGKNDTEIDIASLEKPIADLYPDTTVYFADIAGFTSWSSQRDPEQVFTLLQAVYKTFDDEAKKRGVFKVETIGDCYMAVTGLPDPQEDHAWRMVNADLKY